MLHTKFQGHRSVLGKKIFKVFTIYGHGGHVGHLYKFSFVYDENHNSFV